MIDLAKWIVFLVTFSAAPLAAQDSICRYETTAVGRYYRVMSVAPATDSTAADTVEISQHIQEREAILRAAVEKSGHPSRTVYVNPDFVVRVDCASGWVPVAIDSVVIYPDTIRMFRTDLVDGSTSWRWEAWYNGEMVESGLGDQYTPSAVTVLDGEPVGCSGRCPGNLADLPGFSFDQAAELRDAMDRTRLWGLVLGRIREGVS